MWSLHAYAGLGMTPDEIATRYRGYAADCIMVAKQTSDDASKLRLLDMARAWADLADQAEKNGAAIPIVYETPAQPMMAKK